MTEVVKLPRAQRRSNLVHCFGCVASLIVAGVYTAVAADGVGLVKVKARPPVAVPSLNATLRGVLGFPYGVGVLADSRGHALGDGSGDDPSRPLAQRLAGFHSGHPFKVLRCDEHESLVIGVQTLAFITVVLSLVLTLLHLVSAHAALPRTSPDVEGKLPAGMSTVSCLGLVVSGLQVLSVIIQILVTAFAGVLITKPWHCDNVLVPVLELEKHFDREYGLNALILAVSVSAAAGLLLLPQSCALRPVHPTMSTLNLVVAFMCSAVVVVLSPAVADGTSLAKLKADAPPSRDVPGFATRIRDLVGSDFALGLTKDSRGVQWHAGDDAGSPTGGWTLNWIRRELETGHLLRVLSCDKHTKLAAGTAVLSVATLSCAGAAAFVYFLVGFGVKTGRLLKVSGTCLCAAVCVLSLAAMACGAALYDQSQSCDNPYFRNLKLKDHFDLNYGIPFLPIVSAVGLVAAVLSLSVLRTTADEKAYEEQQAEWDEEEGEEGEEMEEVDEGG
eukprot:TRINITY_DN8886_c1_g1_i2.p1 TRINITY_DN8886_c1_g1~~TRINITY_DN8886_c1_g1_i2.p1  ORF type:complete len:527 (+),score=148.47 TRINITY_DN8886_c1_g1_i2:76-1581(+)